MFLFSILCAGCGTKEEKNRNDGGLPNDLYSLELLKYRKERDLYLLTNANSPLKEEDQVRFEGLSYYPPEAEYIFPCVIRRISSPKETSIGTSKNKPRIMLDIGYVEFTFEGAAHRLRVYMPRDTTEDGLYYFIPFKDATNGTETYGGGRFLDFEDVVNDSIPLDFNRAYNPYCAYNEKYDCPIPPRDNHLAVAIRAGEKQYQLNPH